MTTSGWKRSRIKKDGTGGEKTFRYPRLALNTTDGDVMYRFVEIAGGHARGPYPPRGPLARKQMWCWVASGEEAKEIVQRFLPWLGERRRARALELFGVSLAA